MNHLLAALGRHGYALTFAVLLAETIGLPFPASIALVAAGRSAGQNPIYDTLISRGVTISSQETLKLPRPTLTDGLSAAAQRNTIETLLAGRYDWDDFTRRAVVSPILLKIADDDPSADEVGRRVDLYFVVYGSLDKLAGNLCAG